MNRLFLRVLLLIALAATAMFGSVHSGIAPNGQVAGTAPNTQLCDQLRRRGPEFAPLANACEYGAATPHTLPDFVCTETVEQYLAPNHEPDTITAELTVEKTHSHYAGVSVNGKPKTEAGRTDDDVFEELVTVTGEFAILFDIFDPSSHTEFSAPVEVTLGRTRLRRFDFRVRRENNVSWVWFFPNQKINPGYHGSIFVDPAKGIISRLMVYVSPGEVDPQTPVSELTMTIDYGDVSIAGTGTHHVPVHSENVSCFPILNGCIREELTFGNFHKFGSTVRILPVP